MATQAAVHRRNMESSILFMQQEHANTLKALHQEIHTLQKKCSDLTFQLTMHGYGLEVGPDPDKMKNLESLLAQQGDLYSKLESTLDLRNKKIKQLEMEIHGQKKKYLSELRAQTQSINSIKAELEAKCNNVAYLTSQLHRFKLKEMPPHEGPADTSIRRTVPLVPTPPKEIQSKLHRPHRKHGGDELHQRPLRASSARSSNSSRSDSPDIAPFINRGAVKPIVERRQQNNVLPPIGGNQENSKALLVHQVVPSRKRTDSTSPEMASIVVEHVSPSWVHTADSANYK